jgi:outer membrane lipoprotein SlyB
VSVPAARRILIGLALTAVTLAGASTVAAQAGVVQRIQYGEVVSAEQMIVREQMRGGGARTGGTIGAIAGAALADRGDRWLGGLLGGAVGGAIGNSVEKKARKKKGWELIILLDNGEEIAIQVADNRTQFRPGDRVRMQSGGGRTRVTLAPRR